MIHIRIDELKLNAIINEYCSCGGRGPNDDPCDACAIYHKIIDAHDNTECNCDGAKFVDHIKAHLLEGEDVICTICGKTVSEISGENNET